jgi:hypothetical protein
MRSNDQRRGAQPVADDLPAVRVVAEELAELRVEVLGALRRVAAVATVAEAEVEMAAAELERATVVVGKG